MSNIPINFVSTKENQNYMKEVFSKFYVCTRYQIPSVHSMDPYQQFSLIGSYLNFMICMRITTIQIDVVCQTHTYVFFSFQIIILEVTSVFVIPS